MIDVFIRTNTPIHDVREAFSGFDCNRVCVRNGGPTELWQRTADGWHRDNPGMTLYEDLCAVFIGFDAYLLNGVISAPVDDGMLLNLDRGDATEWLASMERHRYALEDAIGCSIGVEHEGRVIECASATFGLSEFKALVESSTPLGKRLLEWVDHALAAGADQVSVSIAKARQA